MFVLAKAISVNASVPFLLHTLLNAPVKEPSSSGAIKFLNAVNNALRRLFDMQIDFNAF